MSILFSYNEYSANYLTSFCKYVFIPLLFLVEVRNYKLLLQTYIIFALISFCLLGWHPLIGFNVYVGSYMAYGFELGLPCFLGLYILNKQKKTILTKISVFFCFVLTFIFANRSCLIGMLLFLVLYELLIEKKSTKKNIIVAILPVFTFFLYENLERILEFFLDVCEKFSIHSRSLLKLIMMMNKIDIDSISSGRNYIFDTALTMIQNNFPFPLGVGFFETQTSGYVHNVFLDFILNWGGLGFVAIIVIHFAVILSILREASVDLKVLKLLFFSLWFPKLLFSTYFIYNLPFFASIILIAKNDNMKVFFKTKSSNNL